ncbi:hypothetical protein SNEBB_008572 [Seison nebaliae]|nr:hypothetical protein SNEBB_008572 [Seison nebaliae]
MTKVDRQQWGNHMEFLMTCVSFAVGLGNVWRFPYLVFKNGGGAFLLPFLIMLTLVGIPLFLLEISIGQFSGLGPLHVWKFCPISKGIGYSAVMANSFVGLYYNVLIAYSFHFLFSSFRQQLLWNNCGNWWNSQHCVDSLSRNSTKLTQFQTSPAEEYFDQFVLRISDGIESPGSLRWPIVFCLFIAWLFVFIALSKGVQSLGKVAYFTALFPYIMLIALTVRGCTLPGAIDGIKFYLIPDFNKLKSPIVWMEATTQIFYALSLCTGGLIAMSSFSRFRNNSYRDALFIPLLNIGTGIFAGFSIFSVIGFMAYVQQVPITDVATDGPGLAFKVYPQGLTQMPFAPFWSIAFFLMMLTLGFGSEFSIMESVISSLIDQFPYFSKTKYRLLIFRIVVCFTFFILGLSMCTEGGIYVLTLIDSYISGVPFMVIGISELIVIGHFYGVDRFLLDVERMIGFPVPTKFYWKMCYSYVSPALLLATFVFYFVLYEPPKYEKMDYPLWSHVLGWIVVLLILTWIPFFALYTLCIKYDVKKKFKRSLQPRCDWGPSEEEYRHGIYEMMKTKESAPDCNMYMDIVDEKIEEKHDEYDRIKSDRRDKSLSMIPIEKSSKTKRTKPMPNIISFSELQNSVNKRDKNDNWYQSGVYETKNNKNSRYINQDNNRHNHYHYRKNQHDNDRFVFNSFPFVCLSFFNNDDALNNEIISFISFDFSSLFKIFLFSSLFFNR